MKNSCCLKAEKIVHGARRGDYGHPSIQFDRLARLAAVIFDCPVTPRQVGLFLIQLKISRLLHAHTSDSLTDICGYARCLELIDKDSKKRGRKK